MIDSGDGKDGKEGKEQNDSFEKHYNKDLDLDEGKFLIADCEQTRCLWLSTNLAKAPSTLYLKRVLKKLLYCCKRLRLCLIKSKR